MAWGPILADGIVPHESPGDRQGSDVFRGNARYEGRLRGERAAVGAARQDAVRALAPRPRARRPCAAHDYRGHTGGGGVVAGGYA